MRDTFPLQPMSSRGVADGRYGAAEDAAAERADQLSHPVWLGK